MRVGARQAHALLATACAMQVAVSASCSAYSARNPGITHLQWRLVARTAFLDAFSISVVNPSLPNSQSESIIDQPTLATTED